MSQNDNPSEGRQQGANVPSSLQGAPRSGTIGQAPLPPLFAGSSGAGTGAGMGAGGFSSPPGGQAASGESAGWKRLVTFEGSGATLFGIFLANFFLSAITLGIYSFWGKTNRRAYLWSCTRIMGEPLEYTGTGKELFISFLIVMPILAVLLWLSSLLVHSDMVIGQIVIMLGALFLWQCASYRALRFRLTRTRWRGIRGNLTGSALEYGLKATGYFLAMTFSLWLLAPWAISRIVNLQLNNVYFGSRRMSFNGTAKELYKAFFILFAGSAVLLGGMGFVIYSNLPQMTADGLPRFDEGAYATIMAAYAVMIIGIALISAFYHAVFMRWMFGNMQFGEMRTRSTLMGSKLLVVRITNVLLLIFTLGIGYAWVHMRELGASLNTIDYTGNPRLDELLQDTKASPAYGEGLLEAMDVDIAF